MKEILEELNPWWNNPSYEFKAINRNKYIEDLENLLDKKDIIILTGLRRVGKTTLMKIIISRLLKKNIDPQKILFLTLDMLYFSDYSIQDIILEYKKIYKIPHSEKIYLFLDEITYKENFNQELKNLYDLGNYKIYASSSSASVLKDNKAFLTGRSRYFEISPLDFKEFLNFNEIDYKNCEHHLIEKYFEEYMEYGGMPEYVLTKDPQYLSELVELIITKDIIAEKKIKNKKVVFDLFRLLCERVGKQISYNKLSKIIDVDNETVSRYISYFIEAFLFEMIEIKGKLNTKIKSSKKLYCVDVGIRNIITGFKDLGAIYENLVYNKIKEHEPSFIYEDNTEIDFAYKDHLIEAKYNQEMTDKQKKLFNNYKCKNKILAKGVHFFIDE